MRFSLVRAGACRTGTPARASRNGGPASPPPIATDAFRSARRALGAAALVAGLLLALWPSIAAAESDSGEGGSQVEVVQVEGPLDGRIVGQIEDALERAREADAQVLVLELDSPGALRTDALALAERIDASEVPVVAWIGPAGAEATGGVAVVAQSAHVLAMSPASVLGGAGAVDLADADRDAVPEPDPDEAERVADVLGDYADDRGRDPDLARDMVTGGAVVALGPGEPTDVDPDALPWAVDPDAATMGSDAELLDAGALDVAAGELPDVLAAVDGAEVMTAGGERTIAIDPGGAEVRFDNLGVWDAILHGVTDPTLAYLLVVGGLLAILFEVFQPGMGVPGIAGAGLLAAGAWGLWVLPVAWWALLLLLIGLALLAVDLAIGGFGLVTAGGTAALALGSWQLFSGPPPLQPVGWAVALVVVFCVVFFVAIMTGVLRAQGQQALAGAEDAVGDTGVVRSMLNPEGHVFVDGKLWRARAPEDVGKVPTGTSVRVTGLDHERQALAVEPAEREPAGDP
ncbi:hypothetical protein ER308_07700 [Egibacter rhizosphaerae]|uniref:Uncharacterized protein n=1 Tax=Egibacter rhizosphaerae TaxID=1670831 RepID=A0A411YDY2_9ACTN|nr:NfeD family protein [Egibacter rhizosphaerae]QBI19449.1 hypothetical protein ER308_07700 [Egibacter rhizosphaerae]